MISRWRDRFPVLSQLDFYGFESAALSAGQAAAAYNRLAQTDFPSLYGATNLYDDWAEAFAIYVHTRLLDKPYRVLASAPGGERADYRSCIATNECPGKVALVERTLSAPTR